ncbi:unnamed protein product, partial [Protopolystoma xenopodis]
MFLRRRPVNITDASTEGKSFNEEEDFKPIDTTTYVISVFSRNFYRFKMCALVLAFLINFMLLFYKVEHGWSYEEETEGGVGDGESSLEEEDNENMRNPLKTALASSISGMADRLADSLASMSTGIGEASVDPDGTTSGLLAGLAGHFRDPLES